MHTIMSVRVKAADLLILLLNCLFELLKFVFERADLLAVQRCQVLHLCNEHLNVFARSIIVYGLLRLGLNESVKCTTVQSLDYVDGGAR